MYFSNNNLLLIRKTKPSLIITTGPGFVQQRKNPQAQELVFQLFTYSGKKPATIKSQIICNFQKGRKQV